MLLGVIAGDLTFTCYKTLFASVAKPGLCINAPTELCHNNWCDAPRVGKVYSLDCKPSWASHITLHINSLKFSEADIKRPVGCPCKGKLVVIQ